MRKFIGWAGWFVLVVLWIWVVFLFVLPAILGIAPPWIKEGEGLGAPSHDCGSFQGITYYDGAIIIYLLQDGKMEIVRLNRDYHPIGMEEGLELRPGALICVHKYHKVSGGADYARIEGWGQ